MIALAHRAASRRRCGSRGRPDRTPRHGASPSSQTLPRNRSIASGAPIRSPERREARRGSGSRSTESRCRSCRASRPRTTKAGSARPGSRSGVDPGDQPRGVVGVVGIDGDRRAAADGVSVDPPRRLVGHARGSPSAPAIRAPRLKFTQDAQSAAPGRDLRRRRARRPRPGPRASSRRRRASTRARPPRRRTPLIGWRHRCETRAAKRQSALRSSLERRRGCCRARSASRPGCA